VGASEIELLHTRPALLALVKWGDLPAIQIGGRGSAHRAGKLKAYIARYYEGTDRRRLAPWRPRRSARIEQGHPS
jgi:hypothetical protein